MRWRYELGPLHLDPESHVLTHGGDPVALGQRAVAVLALLVARANEYVPKSEIMDTVWPGLVVEEANLAVQISAIRRALAQVPGGEGWIETLARHGYRFVGPVAQIAGRANEPAAPIDRKRTNLPQVLTSFVGREREVAEIKRLLPSTRLLTTTGTGGIGKTRLAVQVAAEVLDAYRDGIWFVDLGRLSDPALVPSTVARVLEVKEVAGHLLTQTLCEHLRAKEVLLVLDNCEHLLGASADLVDAVLRDTAGASVIATSREPLHVAREEIYPLNTLTLPDTKADATAISRSDAVQLFVDRARQHRPRFDLDGPRAHAVAQICVRLDGLPLALELAAARVAVLPVEEILRLLDQRFRLLTRGGGELPRQQTLRAVIDWSYELLDDAEQQLFARLAVFTGGWTVEAAKVVCAGDTIADTDVVYLLIALIEKSLVVTDEAGDRYRMLETVREYAREKLARNGASEVARRHAHAFLAMFERIGLDDIEGRLGYDKARAVLEVDLDNARDALAWTLAYEPQAALAFARPMSLCLTDERRAEQRRLWEATGAWINDDCAAPVRAGWALGCSTFWRGEKPALARTWALVAIEDYRRLGDTVGQYRSLFALARFDTAGVSAEQRDALAQMQELEDPSWPAAVRIAGADAELFVHEADGAFEAAMLARRRVFELAQEAGDSWSANGAMVSLPDLELKVGRIDDAVSHGVELVERLSKTRDQENLQYALLNLVEAWLAKGAAAEARAVAEKGWELGMRFSRQFEWADNLALLAALEKRPRCASSLLGFGESFYVANNAARQVNEARAAGRAEQIARAELGDAEFARLKTAGAELRDTDIAALAFSSSDSQPT